MVLYKKRETFSNISIKVGMIFSKVGLSPNQWTLLTIIPTLVALYFLVDRQFLMAALFFILSSFIDLVDGSVARVMGKVSKLGAYLDTIMDRYVESIIAFGLLFAGLPAFYMPAYAWIFLYMIGSYLTSYSKAAAKEKELVEKEIRGGLLERAERLIILFLGILLAHFGRVYLTYIIVILAVLTNLTALQRIRIATRKQAL
ncbi:MAG: CDP-alcohol phosphatidyltransferase family protein [Candidatus Aenigmatarchaeota archaeon]|nr:MAG: CDP-alcohol phosphatidyltransferase family protein [Candidatus Aenigmarchaeota archaeon]